MNCMDCGAAMSAEEFDLGIAPGSPAGPTDGRFCPDCDNREVRCAADLD